MSRNQSSPLDDDGKMSITVILQTKPAEITREMASGMLDYLVKTLTATDGITSHLSPDDLKNGVIMLNKLKEFINKQGSEVDEMRGIIHRLDASLAAEKAAREALQVRFDALEMNVVNTTALVKGFDLIKLFRSYHLKSVNWDAATNEYKVEKDKMENRLIDTLQFEQFKAAFNATYPMPPETPLLSDIIDLCQERHEEAHSGQIKTITKQEKFLDDCAVYFESHRISESTRHVCLPILQKMFALKTAGQLKGL
jgi:hypothetical protein